MKTVPRSYWIAERNEFMRRARNALFYSKANDISAASIVDWQDVAKHFVTQAREANQKAIKAKL